MHKVPVALFFIVQSISAAVPPPSPTPAPVINQCGKVIDTAYSFDTANVAGASDIVWFQQGFTMSKKNAISLAVTCPVNGTIDLAGSTYPLMLQNKMTLGTDAKLINSGTINGNGLHSVFLTNDLVYSGAKLTLTNVSIESTNRIFTLSANSVLFVPDASFLELKRVTLVIKPGASILMGGRNSRLILTDATLVFEQDYTFSQGSLEIGGDTCFMGNGAHNIVYVSSGQLLIKQNSALIIGSCLTLKYQCTRSDRLVFTDVSSFLILNRSNFIADNVSVNLTRGTLYVKNKGVVKGTGSLGQLFYTQDLLSPDHLTVIREPLEVQVSADGGVVYALWN